MINAAPSSFRLINQENLPPLAWQRPRALPTTRWMQTEWRSVTPFDPLLAIRQKRGGEAPPEDPPKTRENRITAVGNDLYSADSRSFLNPFLRISRCARLFPLHPRQHPLSIELASPSTIPVGQRPHLFPPPPRFLRPPMKLA